MGSGPVHPLVAIADEFDPDPDGYQARPAEWVQERLKDELWSAEREIIEAVRDNRYVAVKSAHHQGKSWVAARIVAWFVDTNRASDIFVVTTAPDETKVKTVLWGEIADAWRKGRLKGRVLEKEWKVDVGAGPDRLVAYGRKPADTDAAGLFGTHAPKMLIVLDEAGAIPLGIFEGVNAITTSGEVHVLAIGNPDDPSSHFAKICKPGSGWHVMTLDGLRSPNFTAEEVKKYPDLQRYMIREGISPSTEQVSENMRRVLLSPQWAAERLRDWKQTSPMWVSRVRGEFPKIATGTLIEPRWVTAAQYRERPAEPYLGRMGVDVARYGTDHSIVVLRLGARARVVEDIPFGPTTELAGRIQQIGAAVGHHPPPAANVDDTGVGGGVTDMLVENGYPVLPLVAGGKCTDLLPNGYPKHPNLRSEWWWNLRLVLAGPSGTGEDGYLDLDPDDDDLAAQLLAVKYSHNSKGQIVVESKDEMRKRGLPSPDRADALAYSLVQEVDQGFVIPEAMLTAGVATMEW